MSKAPTKAKTRTVPEGIKAILEGIKAEILKLESSSSHGDFRQACRDCAAILDKYMEAP